MPTPSIFHDDFLSRWNTLGRESFRTESMNNSERPDSSSNWVYKPELGAIVHQEHCSTCYRYIAHMSNAMRGPIDCPEYHSLVLAEGDRDAEFQLEFDRGWNAGLQEGEIRLTSYHTKLDHALASVSEYRRKYDETLDQLKQKSSELDRLQAAYENLQQQTSFNSIPSRQGNIEVGIRAGANQPPSSVADPIPPVPRHPPTDASDDAHITPSALPTSPQRFLATRSLTLSTLSPPEAAGKSKAVIDMIIALVTELNKDRDIVESVAENLDGLSTSRPQQPLPSRIIQVEAAAGVVLRLVQMYWTKIRKVNPSSHTPVQEFLLSSLTMPQAESPSIKVPPAPLLPVGPVYVDASGIGIGFVFENQWQMWRFDPGWREPQCRDIQWAEAVAVELGLRLMIQAGYSRREISMRSDNQAVVDALAKGSPIGESEVTEIVYQIKKLCQVHDITLAIKWIPGKENPADAPSRFEKQNPNQRFPHDIRIPAYLQEFVAPARCDGDSESSS